MENNSFIVARGFKCISPEFFMAMDLQVLRQKIYACQGLSSEYSHSRMYEGAIFVSRENSLSILQELACMAA